MKILVTGGAGFIGSHVVEAFLAQKHEVVVLDDLSTGKRENVPDGVKLYDMDIRDPALAEVFAEEKFDLVDHHAAKANVRESLLRPVFYADVNILGSLHLLELCRETGVKKFIFVSSGGAVYGEPQYLPADEKHMIAPLDPYGASKAALECYLPLYMHNYGLSYTILRYSNVYGPRQDPLGEAGVVAIFTGKMLNGEQAVINGTGEQERDFVYVGDVAAANVQALQLGDGRAYNIGTGVGTSVNQVFASLKAATGYQHDAVHGPAKLGEVFKTYLDISQARDELKWQPVVSLDEGLRRTVDYFRARV